MNAKEHVIRIDGLTRRYPVVTLSGNTSGIYFFLPGDTELIERCGDLIARRISPDCRYLVVPEVGGIPLAHAVGRRLGLDYLVVRKSVKPYMENPLIDFATSITTPGRQELVIDARDIEKIAGRKIAVIDDVISTSGTLRGLCRLAEKCAAEVACIACVFLEGDATAEGIAAEFGCPCIALGYLPVFPGPERTMPC